MFENGLSVSAIIGRARNDPDVLGELLEYYRPFLLLMARRYINPKLARRCDVADAIQQTFVEAHRSFHQFDGSGEPEFSGWITRIHENILRDLFRRHVLAERRTVDKEDSVGGADGSVAFFWKEAAANDSTPSKRLIKGEKALRLAQLLQGLPEGQCEAIRLRFMEEYPVKQIAEAIDRSVPATAGLIKRGLKNLREKMNADSWL